MHGNSQHAVCILWHKFKCAVENLASIVLDFQSVLVNPALNLVFLHELLSLILHYDDSHPVVEGRAVLQELCLVFLVDLIVDNQQVYLASSLGDLVSFGVLHEFLVCLPLLLMTCEPVTVALDRFRFKDPLNLFAKMSEAGFIYGLQVPQGAFPCF